MLTLSHPHLRASGDSWPSCACTPRHPGCSLASTDASYILLITVHGCRRSSREAGGGEDSNTNGEELHVEGEAMAEVIREDMADLIYTDSEAGQRAPITERTFQGMQPISGLVSSSHDHVRCRLAALSMTPPIPARNRLAGRGVW